MSISLRRILIPIAALVLACLSHAQEKVSLKYDFRPGDHLIYRQTVERDVKSSDREIATGTVFRTHVLIMGVSGETISVGQQRNRESAELRKYVGRDGGGLEEARARFDERTAKSAKWFADAQEFRQDGTSANVMDSELTGVSKLISAIHALEPLPSTAVGVGDTWPNAIGGTFRVVNVESDGSKTMVEVVSDPPSRINEHFWFSLQDGLITRMELEGDYKMSAMTDVHTGVTFEFLERRRDENPKAWLADPDLRNAALEAYAFSRWLQPDLKLIRPLAVSTDARTRELANALLPSRRHTRRRKSHR